jgi:hypothetical protein
LSIRKTTFMTLKKLLLTLGALMTLSAQAQTARVQVIHNCPDAIADSVDVYLNGSLLLDNFAFRTATPFIDAPADTGSVRIGIAPKNSMSEADTIYSVTTTLNSANTYILVAEGIVSSTGYTPAPAFGLNVYNMGQEAATTAGNTDVLVVHGSTDAPIVDVQAAGSTIVDDLAYGQFAPGYLNLPTADYILDVTDASGAASVRSYSAPLQTLNLHDEAIVVLASGFLNSSDNSYGPSFGLYAALPAGGALVPLPPVNSARVQVIHNCADAAAATVDVYLNGALLLDNFAFRTATPFIDAPADTGTVRIGIAPANSMSEADTIYSVTTTLNSANRYIIVAEGIVSPTGYSPAPAFGLNVYATAQEEAINYANTDVLVVHGATDAPTVDVRAGTTVLVDDISYGNINAGYLNLPNADYIIDITDASGNTTVESYSAPLQSLNLTGAAITVLASGFLDPAMNSNGPAFGLWAALPAGGNLVMLPLATSVKEVPVNNNTLKVFPNPAYNTLNIDGANGNTTYSIRDIMGKELMTGTGNSIDISNMAAGMYILKATNGSAVKTGKFTKQ